MTLQQLRYVVAISDAGSYNKAAEALFIAQPSLTNSIKELEKELDITIFYRNGKGSTLTEDGRELVSYARQILGQTDALLGHFSQNDNFKRKFGVSTQHYSFATKAFVEMVKQFDTKEYEFAIRETRTSRVIEHVAGQKSEIGILYLSDDNRTVLSRMLRSNGLEFHKLMDCKAYVYLWKNHPLAKEESITYEQLKEYPCLMFEQGEQNPAYLQEEILGGNDYPQIVWANDRATMLNLMIGINGYTLCSGIICEELNGSECFAIPYQGDELNPNSIMEIGYITKEGAPLSKIGRCYIDEVKKYLGLETEEK